MTAFGQGQVLATPLGMASVAQTVANGGVRSPTSIVKDPALKSDAKPVQVTSKENAKVLTGLMRGRRHLGHRRRRRTSRASRSRARPAPPSSARSRVSPPAAAG